METNYATLRRPKRKLCYLTNKESPPEWTAPQTLEEIDKMFDDLDPSSHIIDDLSHPCPLLQTFDTECERIASPVPQEVHLKEELPKCQTDPEGEALHPATSSPSPKLDIDLDIPFEAHGPMKTSSPIEDNVVEHVEELDNEKHRVVSPVLFACEDDEKEGANTEPQPIQEPQCNRHVEEELELESPPSKVLLSKPERSSRKNKVEGSCSSKESQPVKEKTPKKPQTPVLEGKRKTPRRENVDPPVSVERQEPELAAPKKDSKRVNMQPSVELTRVEKDMTAFLKKLRDSAQPRPACSRKSVSPVKVPPPPPEPDDDFLILEDDRPLWFSIPSKTATSKKQRQSKTSSTDRDSSTDRGTKESPLETAQTQQESEQANSKVGSQTVSQKTKKVKRKEKNKEVTEPGNDEEELPRPEDLPAGDLREEEKPNKKKRLKKVPSKERDKEEEQPKDTASRKTDEEKPTLEREKKAQKPSDVKRSKSVKDGNENAKTSRSKSLKGARKVTQGSDVVKETMYAEAGKEQSQSLEEHADAEDLGPLSDKERNNSETQTEKDVADGKDKHNKLPAVSEESSPEDCWTPGRRKRRQPGEWWLNHQTAEETKVTDTHLTPKKSKPYNKEPSAAVPSPVKTKKDRVLKKGNQTQPAPSSSQKTNKAREKKTTQKKNRNAKGDKPDKVFHTIEAEQSEGQEQLEILDQSLDVESSPLVLTQRDHSFHSGEQVFPRAYSSEKLSITPAPVSPRRPREQFRAAESNRRRRKPPGNWWAVNDVSEDISSQPEPQQQEPKPRKERKKQSKQSRSPRLGTPKNGNMAVSSKPPGGTPVPPLKPTTVKRSLAMVKDIFTSAVETPTVISSRETVQKNKRHKASAYPAKDATLTDCATFNKSDRDIPSMDAGEHNSPVNHEAPQDRQSEDRLKLFRSGPSSMIELQQYEEEEDDDLSPPLPRVSAALSISDLCAPPLKPLVLQSKDKANLAEWFQSLWPVDRGAEITPDQFDWYFHQGRAIGFLVDLNCGSICNGKILLGSYMKKPLWVDHSATTVFELLTSSVTVVIDSKESRFHPGQSFMVPCGHAYSIHNINAQPAVVYFTRILAESSD
ncbi:titin isoform X1 [Epinephelus moara]|uniref:titin isoform X1 n=1 Tax=Epinephelus moara TaxID=300413 RepID=UPI00214DF53E|nr:titin isoform X1 [Epinephelus moara]